MGTDKQAVDWWVAMRGLAVIVGLAFLLPACRGSMQEQADGDAGKDSAEPQQTVASPQFSVPSGTYHEPQRVEISTTTPHATIHYTFDGNAPTLESQVFEDAFLVGYGTTTIKALARADGLADSLVTAAIYTIEESSLPAAAIPLFTPPGGTYAEPLAMTLSTATPGATIYFTVDGSLPSTGSAVFGDFIPIGVGTTIVRARAAAQGYATSAVGTAAYTVLEPTAATPAFYPPGGGYVTPLNVTLSTATPSAEIHYTLDGTPPTSSSPLVTGPLAFRETVSINAIATA